MKANLKEIRKRRVYSEEFKKEIVNFYESGKYSVLQMERLYGVNDGSTPHLVARLRRVPTYFCKLNKAFTTRFFKMYYHKGSTFTLQKTELSSS